MDLLKRCTRCKNEKPVGDFYRDKAIKDGRKSWCKRCCHAVQHSGEKGKFQRPLYTRWQKMIQRCTNEKNLKFRDYGARGISVCEEWSGSYRAFAEWALANGYDKSLILDRRNNDGNYEPGNCRFVTPRESTLNQRLIQKNSPTGYRGVSPSPTTGKFVAQAGAHWKLHYIGTFSSAIEAARARDKYVTDNNLGLPLNFPMEGALHASLPQ